MQFKQRDQFPKIALFFIVYFSGVVGLKSQCECPYPILFIHGWTGDATSWQPFYTDANFVTAWGGLTDTYDAVLNANSQSNAFGIDNNQSTPDDDALFQFVNDPNDLLSGCLYAIDFDWYWNEDQTNPNLLGTSAPNGESDSNSSSIEKQGWAVGEAIKAILAANPDKNKVVLLGHSMGGLAAREYLQRFENGTYTWWVDPSDPVNGHKVAKLATTGTPHRGSNASLGNLGSIFSFDERSESVRDLRFSYGTGLFSSDNSAPYLFGGPEDDNVDQGDWKSPDVDCDGDYDTNPIISINEIGANNPWDGTKENPAMGLPDNVKYSYYTSRSSFYDFLLLQNNGGDGVVADERQWIYSGGNGSTASYQNGSSIPSPNDGVDYRLSERIHSAGDVFHTNQTGDVDDIARLIDEGDYPFFAYDVNTGIDYSGLCQQRADFVPLGSEYTNAGLNTIDGDWYKFNLASNTPGVQIEITPHPSLGGRVDFYDVLPSDYDNSNAATYSMTWNAGASPVVLNAQTACMSPGDYYLRITHVGTTTTSWETPYKFRINELPCVSPTGLSAMVTALTAQLNWTPSSCVTQYEVKYREVGTTSYFVQLVNTNTHTVTGLLPDTDYEFEVSTDCGSGFALPSASMPFSTTACPSVLYIPSDPSLAFVPEGIYNVDMVITSDGLILNSTDVSYIAGDNVELLSNFEVQQGALFLADINNCSPSPLQVDAVTKSKQREDTKRHLKQDANHGVYLRALPVGKYAVNLDLGTNAKSIHSLNLYDRQFANPKSLASSLKKAGKHQQEMLIDMRDWEPGKYFVVLKIGDEERIVKLVRRPDTEVRNRN
jgi:pimeloyl-ACP methyl ester carboxylesterase